MNDKDKFNALAHLLKLLNLGEHPTIRESGITEDVVAELQRGKLITLADDSSKAGQPDADRLAIFEITVTGMSWALQYEERQKQVALHPPIHTKIASALGKRLWDLFWHAVTGGVSFFLGWYLGHHFK